MEVRFRLLGPLEVTVDGTAIELPAGRPRRLLTMLALRANTAVAAEALVESLWDGRPPRTVAKALQVHVSQLRRVLPQGHLLTRAPGYVLRVEEDELDVLSFERDLASGRAALRAGDPRRAAELLDVALGHWRAGEPADVPDAVRTESDRLAELRSIGQEDWLAARLALGEHADVLAPLHRAIAEHPYSERLVEMEMVALYRAGRQADALDAFARARARFDADLGLEPGPALRELQQRILAQDPSLAAPGVSAPPVPIDAPALPEPGARRELPSGLVGLVFTDVEGSTELLRAAGEAYGELLGEHHRLLRMVWEDHGGVEVSTAGDGFFVAFPSARAALSAAAAAQRALSAHAWPDGQQVKVRMGVHAGEPQQHDDTYWGIDVHYGARLCAAAHGGQVLVSSATGELVPDADLDDLGEHALKDFPTARHLFHLVVDGRRGVDFPPPRTLERIRTNLPASTERLIGREQALSQLGSLIDGHSLVTITGPGGSGKTRLALEAAHRRLEEFEAVWLVKLDQVATAEEAFAALARTLGLSQQPGVSDLDRALDHARGRRLLLVLDNVEHVISAAPGLGRLAAAGPGVRVVATSQVPLRVAGEHVVRLAPLALPTGAEQDAGALAAVPAVELLVERARQSGSGFTVTAENAEAVAQLTTQLEGMPLAIELAAARLDILGPAALSTRLERGIDALGPGARDLPPRQRGLRATLEWTCELLDESQRMLLARLSVFPAGFTVTLAEASFGECVDGLEALLAASLLTRGADGRLSLRPPVRRFAAELLTTADEEAAANASALDALAELAEPFERRWMARLNEGRRVLSPEGPNIIAAIDWARDRDHPRHARVAAATAWWMTHSGRFLWAADHLRLALTRTDDPRMRARCLQALGALGFSAADPTMSSRAADAWRELGDADGEFFSALYGANLHGHARQPEAGLDLLARCQAIADRFPDDRELHWLLAAVRAESLYVAGDHAAARALVEPWLAGAPTGSTQEFWVATRLADIALSEGRNADALGLYGRCMAGLADTGTPLGQVVQAITAALALIGLGRKADAAVTIAVCELACTELGWTPGGVLGAMLKEARAGVSSEDSSYGRRRAEELGMVRGLEWVRATALAER